MIYCVRFADVDAYLRDLGYQSGQTDSHLLYSRDKEIVTIHKPNERGDVTEIEVQGACNAAGVDPPSLAPHWCD